MKKKSFKEFGFVTNEKGDLVYHGTNLKDEFGYKSERAYKEDWDAVCYIPCQEFGEEEEVSEQDCATFTHNDLLEDCHGNEEFCDYIFNKCQGFYHDTYICDMGMRTGMKFFPYAKVGNLVKLEHDENGLYKVLSINPRKEFCYADAELERVSDKKRVTAKVMDLLPTDRKSIPHSKNYREIRQIV
jgi:hypothetical protein